MRQRSARVSRFTQNAPFVQPSKLILTVFIPFTPSLEVILIVQTTADGASTRQVFADVFPFHSFASKLDDPRVFLWRPF